MTSSKQELQVFAVVAFLLMAQFAEAAAALHGLDGVWRLAKPQSALSAAEELPFTEQGRARYEQNRQAAANGDYGFDPTMNRCSSPGLPRLMLTPGRFRIFQRPSIVAIVFEWSRQLRQIDLRDVPREQPLAGTMNGVSYGRWNGNSLVVESGFFSTDKLLDNLIPNSERLQLVEHMRLRDKNTLEVRITIQDPEIFTRSWGAVLTYERQPEDVFPFAEDVCLDRKSAGQLPLPH